MSCFLVPYFSCQDSIVYLPGGTLSILNEPSAPVTALAPFETWPQTFSSWPLFRGTEGSVMGFLAQNGSASRCSLAAVGILPPKSPSPSIDPAANAAQGSSAAQITAIAAVFQL